jgi:CDP-diacylglycerol---glycerol-3-phosphate 3-phosphatidyltransferase
MLADVAGLLSDVGVTPAMLSLGGLIAMLIAGVAFAEDWTVVAGVLVFVGGGLDGLDGEVARVTCMASESGAFIDSVCDHLGDWAIYLGLAWRAVTIGASAQVLLLLAASFGSLFGSLVRARASLLHIDLKEIGFITRFERLLIVLIGSLGDCIDPALWALAVLTNISALQRLLFVLLGPQHTAEAIAVDPREALAKIENQQVLPPG